VTFAPPPAGRAENHDSCRASVRRKKMVAASRLKEEGSLMQYDLARITVRPAAAATALPLLGAWLEKTPSKGRLLACWTSEIGALNDILLLRGYDDADTLAAERDAVLRGGDLYGLGDLVVAVEADTWVPFPFTAPVAPGEVGPIFEVRTYLLRPGGLPATIEGWEKALPARLALSPLVTAMYSVSGAMPRFCHVWPYRSLEERQRIRARAVETGVWPPPGGAGRLLAQKTEIFLPARFSPLR